MPIVEYVLSNNLKYDSGPSWLYNNILKYKDVIAVSGTHGKTTTTSMVIDILKGFGLNPGFLVGGVSLGLDVSANITDSDCFVIEADEYDTAFFDKRSKFQHYKPRTLIINNLEFDHADIFDSICDIKKQFHHLIRMMPAEASIIYPSCDKNIQDVLAMGCWSKVYPYTLSATENEAKSFPGWKYWSKKADGSHMGVSCSLDNAELIWEHIGYHNMQNAMSAIVATSCNGVPLNKSINSLSRFQGVKRRMEMIFSSKDVTVYDDFAHHPTAIKETVLSLRAKIGVDKMIVIFEPRSNTMKMGVHQSCVSQSFHKVDEIFVLTSRGVDFSFDQFAADVDGICYLYETVEGIISKVMQRIEGKTHILIMSNGGFDGIHGKLTNLLAPIVSY
jgi:UDP-N-acetylmuramate: L-alanyl-gamma-D-glutamyl-meso-diaminopimelate ligase